MFFFSFVPYYYKIAYSWSNEVQEIMKQMQQLALLAVSDALFSN